MNNKKDLIKRIIIDPEIMAGKPVVKGTRLTVPHILGLLTQGISTEEILADYKNLTKEDILACFAFAQQNIENTTFIPVNY